MIEAALRFQGRSGRA